MTQGYPMLNYRYLLLTCFLFFFTVFPGLSAHADEVIRNYDVAVDVQKNGDIIVTETLQVNVENKHIRHGIFRDLPRYFMDKDKKRFPYGYKIISVQLDGHKEPYKKSTGQNNLRIRIGKADRMVPTGLHRYVIKYRVKNQIRYFADYDEIYWNATGTYWAFPIEKVKVVVHLPTEGFVQQSAYTGYRGQSGQDYSFEKNGQNYVFKTTRPLKSREGITIALGFEKGIVDPPSRLDEFQIWWYNNGSLVILGTTLGGVFLFLLNAWNKRGRDPVKNPVFPRYKPPEGYSAAAVYKLKYNIMSGNNALKALIATLLGLAIKKRIKMDVGKKKTMITKISPPSDAPELNLEEQTLLRLLPFKNGKIVLDRKPNLKFTKAVDKFNKYIEKTYGKAYFSFNAGYTVGSIVISIGAIAIAAVLSHGNLSPLFWGLIAALVIVNIIFLILMPAPTRKGQDLKTEIEGFKLYLKTAEKNRLNAHEIGVNSPPPPMSKTLYEAFLPYAIALGVEKPWTRYFEKTLPDVAQNYRPSYAAMSSGNYNSLQSLNQAMVSNLNSGIVSASPPSSSGSGGGGSSGGGGGGGGGGGW